MEELGLDADSLRGMASAVRFMALSLLLLFVLNSERLWCLNLFWRLYVSVAITAAVAIAMGGIRDWWDVFSPFLDIACAYFWCKKWEQLSEAGTQ